jgi:hypothetical protein
MWSPNATPLTTDSLCANLTMVMVMVGMVMFIFSAAARWGRSTKKCLWISWLNAMQFRKFYKVPSHCICIFSVCIILGLNFRNFELESIRIQVQSSSVTFSYMKRDVLRIETFNHSSRGLVHQLLCNSETPTMKQNIKMGKCCFKFNSRTRSIICRPSFTNYILFYEKKKRNYELNLFFVPMRSLYC